MNYSIEELCKIVNEKIVADKSLISADSRISNELSVRRIRDYLSKGMISPTEGTGREKFFNDSHVEQLVELRKLQLNGVSEKLIKTSYGLDKVTYSSSEKKVTTLEKEQTQTNSTALDFLKGLSSTVNEQLDKMAFGNNMQASASIARGLDNNITKKQFSDKLIGQSSSLYQTSSKSFTEHSLDVSGKIFLKIDNSISMDEQIEIIKSVKQSLK